MVYKQYLFFGCVFFTVGSDRRVYLGYGTWVFNSSGNGSQASSLSRRPYVAGSCHYVEKGQLSNITWKFL